MSRMKSLMRSFIYWLGMDCYIKFLVENSRGCVLVEKSQPIKFESWLKTDVPWKRLHIDFAGPVNGSYYFIIWNSILSVKKDKIELHVIWLDLANAYGSVLHHLILNFFNFPSKVGEIIMKYFNSVFMKFNVKDYTTKSQAYEISIMMGCVISPLLFILAMELILRGAANTSKGVMKNEYLIFPPSRAFMDDITILVSSKISADGLLQRYYDLFT